VTLNYVSDGDTNGLIYYLGTFLTGSFVTPTNNGVVMAAVPPGGSGTPNTLIDRTTNQYSTNGSGSNEYFKIDIGVGRTLLASKFSFKYRNDTATFCPTAWTWEGSNDNSSWTTLATVTGETPAISKWVSTTPSVMTTAYRYFRIKQTGNNNNGSSHMSGDEIELYGTLTDYDASWLPPATGGAFDTGSLARLNMILLQ
jgi:hypothetical protein